jgi:outer membrane receptor for ferrienterochelin and colicin
LLVVVCLFAAATFVKATGQNQGALPRLTDLTLDQRGDVDITSVSQRPEERWRTAVAVHVITREDIQRWPKPDVRP